MHKTCNNPRNKSNPKALKFPPNTFESIPLTFTSSPIWFFFYFNQTDETHEILSSQKGPCTLVKFTMEIECAIENTWTTGKKKKNFACLFPTTNCKWKLIFCFFIDLKAYWLHVLAIFRGNIFNWDVICNLYYGYWLLRLLALCSTSYCVKA